MRFFRSAIATLALGLGAVSCGAGGSSGSTGVPSAVIPATAPNAPTVPHAGDRTTLSAALGSYSIDPTKITSAGISSGAYMATQLHVAYSGTFSASAIFAGGPYYCAQDNTNIALSDCTNNYYPTNLPVLEQDTDNAAFYGYVDPTSNLSGEKAYVFSGTRDTTVYPSVVRDARSFYQHYGVNVTSNFSVAAGHGWISPDGTVSCGTTASPYVNNCGIDAEQTFLTLFYGTLSPRRVGALTGSLKTFDQNEFFYDGYAPNHSMDTSGYVFVPAACASGTTCKLVVALHGCKQGVSAVGTAFVTKSGINEWADTNKIIVLYPQAIATPPNPNGCWDWFGYLSTDYASQSGAQMSAIEQMVQRI